jgi:translation elongation factor EF-G
MCRQEVVASDVPSNMQDLVMEKRRELIEVVSEVDDQLAEAFLSDEPISADELKVYNLRPLLLLATSFETDVGM